MQVRYLHTMVRVKDLEASMRFYELIGLEKTRHHDSEEGRFSLIFMAPPGQHECPVELTYNWTVMTGCPPTAAISGIWPTRSRTSTRCASIFRTTA